MRDSVEDSVKMGRTVISDDGMGADRVQQSRAVDIGFYAEFMVENAIHESELKERFGNDPLRYIKFLIQEEGLFGCVICAGKNEIKRAWIAPRHSREEHKDGDTT